MQDEKDIRPEAGDEAEIDLLELAVKLWNNRKRLIKWTLAGAIVGLIVAFSIPREYDASVKLAPEVGNNKQSSGLGALASMAGLSSAATSGADAVYPQLYPDVVSSVPFLTGLFNVKIPLQEGAETSTVEQYMTTDISSPWWSYILKLPGKIIGLFRSKEEVDEDHVLDNFHLTQDESDLVNALSDRIGASVDAKTSVVTISVKMQDPIVSAVLADTVVKRLQQYVTDYRTNKARQDLEYAEKLNNEAQQEYYRAQQALADYSDRNQGIATQTARITRDRLDNEASLAFSLYNQTSQQVQQAKAKVQENTPVYAIVVPATVPVRPSSPRKLLILIGFSFLAFVACSGWILFLQPLVEEQKNKIRTSESTH
ncbi:MAG: chain-length determining protein [Bacteroides sp.]|nr:chain-length determining protein [Bacteroides sp.]